MRNERSPYYLPGGRVKLSETAEIAVIRKIREELNIKAGIVLSIWLCQSFINEDGDLLDYHELCIYYLVDISETDLFSMDERFSLPKHRHRHTFE